MFRRLWPAEKEVTIFVDERPMRAAAGDSVAAALLAGGVVAFRTSAVSGAARAPYCMIGNCFECLLEIDGRPDRQGCLVRVAEGMRVRLQRGEKAA